MQPFSTSGDQTPNILFIIDDQHRYDWLGCAGADWMKTPNIDALARRGMRMNHCYTTSPVCAPARVSLATGLLPHRLGATSNDDAILPVCTPNFYRHFRDHGYRVSLVGRHDLAKWSAPGSIHGNRPLNFSYGFTDALEIEGGIAMSHREKPNGPYGQYLLENGLWETYCTDFRKNRRSVDKATHDSVLPKKHHQDVFVGDRAVERIKTIEDDYPWFMFVSFQGPHNPFDPPTETADLYRDADMPSHIQPEPSGQPRRMDSRRYNNTSEEEIQQARRQYAAKITLIDEQVGRMVDAVARRGLSDNTIIVFCSDHGEMLGDHNLWIKHCAYEPSWRVPCVIAGPGVTTGASDALVELSDLNPTLVELAGLEAQLCKLDAKSFAPVLRGETDEHRDCVVCQERSPIPSQGSYRAIRTRSEKAIFTDNDLPELYDMENDPDEKHNLAKECQERYRQLKAKMQERFIEHAWLR